MLRIWPFSKVTRRHIEPFVGECGGYYSSFVVRSTDKNDFIFITSALHTVVYKNTGPLRRFTFIGLNVCTFDKYRHQIGTTADQLLLDFSETEPFQLIRNSEKRLTIRSSREIIKLYHPTFMHWSI